MKKLILLLVLAALGLGAWCGWQWRQVARQQAELAALRAEREQQAQQLGVLQEAAKDAEQQRESLVAQLAAARIQPTAPPPAPPPQPEAAPPAPLPPPEPAKTNKNEGGFGNFFAKLMEDPDTRKLIREQQRGMLDQLYAPLIKQLGLTPDEAAAFKDLLADNMIKSTEKATAMFSGTNRAALVTSLTTEQQQFDDQLRDFLGDARFAQYQDYQQTVGERTQLNMYNQQNAGALALSDVQREALLTFTKEEKQYVAASTGQSAPAGGQNQANLQAMLSGEQADKLLQNQETVNQRVYDRARTILSPDQLEAFGKFQANQVQMMRVGMNMARKFLTPETSGASPPTPGR